jgi:hypothetical protein
MLNHLTVPEAMKSPDWIARTRKITLSVPRAIASILRIPHNVSEAHLHRYLAEADFMYNHRHVTDAERAAALLRGAKGKRLRQPNEAPHA